MISYPSTIYSVDLQHYSITNVCNYHFDLTQMIIGLYTKTLVTSYTSVVATRYNCGCSIYCCAMLWRNATVIVGMLVSFWCCTGAESRVWCHDDGVVLLKQFSSKHFNRILHVNHISQYDKFMPYPNGIDAIVVVVALTCVVVLCMHCDWSECLYQSTE